MTRRRILTELVEDQLKNLKHWRLTIEGRLVNYKNEEDEYTKYLIQTIDETTREIEIYESMLKELKCGKHKEDVNLI